MSDSDYVDYDTNLARNLVSKSNLASSGGLSTNHLSRASGLGKLTRLELSPIKKAKMIFLSFKPPVVKTVILLGLNSTIHHGQLVIVKGMMAVTTPAE